MATVCKIPSIVQPCSMKCQLSRKYGSSHTLSNAHLIPGIEMHNGDSASARSGTSIGFAKCARVCTKRDIMELSLYHTHVEMHNGGSAFARSGTSIGFGKCMRVCTKCDIMELSLYHEHVEMHSGGSAFARSGTSLGVARQRECLIRLAFVDTWSRA